MLAGVLLLWLVMLALDDADLFNWGWPTDALGILTLATWMWIGASVFLVLIGGMVGIVYAMGLGGKAPTRQVQCQDCRAVFFIPDNGRRPLTHFCPSCKALGVYDGGEASTTPALDLGATKTSLPVKSFTCPNCNDRFAVADTGVRPLRITCPKCATSGLLK